MKRIAWALTLFACIITHNLFSQPNIPVDPLTGAAQVTIPLGGISYGSLSVPVSISYNSTGLKPNSSEGSAGMNWDVSAGGKVSREIRSLPDDYNGNSNDPSDTRKGWLLNYAQQINDFVFQGDDNLLVCSDEVNDWTFLNDLGYVRDSEPDVFSFEAPGLSGKFVFGPDKLPKMMPYQDVKVEFVPAALNAPITSIIITRNDGTKYTFGMTETTTRSIGFYKANVIVSQYLTDRMLFYKPLKTTTTWGLTKISSPSGESINLCYGDYCKADTTNFNRYEITTGGGKEIRIVSATSTAASQPFDQYFVSDFVEVKLLHSIKSPSAEAVFLYHNWTSIVNEIKYSYTGMPQSKLFRLLYQDVKNTGEQKSRKFLKNIYESNSICGNFPSYEFEYYDVTFGPITGTTTMAFNQPNALQDLWGYYNGVAVSKNPTIYYYPTKTGAERYRFYPIPGLTPKVTINGADRGVNPSKVYYGSLKKIIYPTGGSGTITYEPNQYFDAEANVSQYGPGLRVSQTKIEDNVIVGAQSIITNYEYKTATNASSGKWIYRSVFGYHDVDSVYATLDDQSHQSAILYERVTVSQPQKGKRVFEYLLPGMYPLTTVSDWSASKTMIARSASGSCTPISKLKQEYFSHPFSPNMNYDFERGLPWKITDYNEAGQNIHEKEYTYQRLGTPTVLVKGIRYQLLKGTTNITTGANLGRNLFVYSRYSLLTNVGKVAMTETERTSDMSDVTKKFETSSTYTYSSVHYMVNAITQLNSEGNTYKTKYKYAKDFSNLTQPNASSVKTTMLKKLNDDFRHGTLIETINSVIKSGVETTTGASIKLFGSFPDSLGVVRALPNETKTFIATTGFAEATIVPASGANQVLIDSAYRSASFIDAYDNIGNPTTVRDIQKNLKSAHFGYKKSTPLLEISNAAANEVVFAGFESYTGGEFNVLPVGITYVAGRSGLKAAQISSGSVLQRTTVTKGRGKYYRYSCWINAAAASQVTFKILNGITLVTSASVSYSSSDVNNWKYFEGRIDLTSAPATFKLTVESNATIAIDDIAFYPETAEISSATYQSFAGKTSVTDSRGNSVYYEYDELGRLKYVIDQDKNLRQTNDYYYKIQPYPVLSSTFGSTHAINEVVVGATVTYTANTFANCSLSPITYDWYVNETKEGTNLINFQRTFSTAGIYVVKLVATHPTLGSSSTSITYNVEQIGTGPINVVVNDASGTNSYAYCDAIHTKTFNAALTGCFVLPTLQTELPQASPQVQWYHNVGGGWTPISSTTSISEDGLTLTFDPIVAFGGLANLSFYSIKCDVSTVCPITGEITSSSYTRSISYNSSQICQ